MKKVEKVDYVIFGAVALLCFFCFQQRDLLHTVGCSVGYLNGHILDFYDYCGENGIHPSYMPTVYLLFAVWNIPMRLFGFLTVPTEDISLVAAMWSKLLPCLVYLASGWLIDLICLEIGMGKHKSRYCVYACLTMPVAFYAQFIFGQYDIFMTACALLGVYYYLKKKDCWFIFWFAIAVTFKYTALVLFLPLLLLRCKNPWKIIRSCVLLAIPLAIEYLLYKNSAGFRDYTFGVGNSGDSPMASLFSAGIYTGYQLSAIRYQVSLLVLVYGAVLGLAYFTRTANRQDEMKWAFYLCCLSLFALFGLSKWHPQWLLLAVPFWVISAYMNRETKIFMILDLLFMGFYVMFIVQTIPNNVDQAMLNKGVLRGLVDGDIGTKLMMKDIVGRIAPELCLSILSMMMLVYALFKHPKYALSDMAQETQCTGWLRTRFLAGVGFFVLPAFLCLFAALRPPYAGYQVKASDETRQYVNLSELGDSVSQRFCSTGKSIDKLQFSVGVNARQNAGYLKLTLIDCSKEEDEGGYKLYEVDWPTDSLVDGEIITADFGSIPAIEGGYYEALFEITQANGDYLLSLPYSAEKQETTGNEEEYALKDGQKQGYQLEMTVYQQ